MVNHTYLLGVFLFTSKTFSQNTYFGKRDQLNSQLTNSLPFKSQKQNTTFTLSTPRGYSESTLYDPISPFQQIYGQNCGKVDSDRILFDKNGDRIVGGQLTSLELHPWQVYVQIGGIYMCGGVFISDKWVMTAGHCAYRYSAHHIIIIHGLTSLTGFQVPTGNWASVNSVHVHDQYQSGT